METIKQVAQELMSGSGAQTELTPPTPQLVPKTEYITQKLVEVPTEKKRKAMEHIALDAKLKDPVKLEADFEAMPLKEYSVALKNLREEKQPVQQNNFVLNILKLMPGVEVVDI